MDSVCAMRSAPLKLLLGVLDARLASCSRGLLSRPSALASPSRSLLQLLHLSRIAARQRDRLTLVR